MFNLMFWRRRQPWWERYGANFEARLPSFEMPRVDMPRFRTPEMPQMPDMPYYHRRSGFDWGRWWPYVAGAALIGAALAYFYNRGFGPMEEYVFPGASRGNGVTQREPVGTTTAY